MMKTDTERPARPFILPIAYGILKGYLKSPMLFMFNTILTLPWFKRTLPEDLPREFVKTAALQGWMYLRLKRRLGWEKAYEIMRAVILPAALAVQHANFRSVEVGRTFENLIKYQQRTNREGPTRWNRMEIEEQSENRYAFRVKNCLFHQFFSHIGAPELTRFMCATDNAIFASYLPEEVVFHRKGLRNTIAEGASECLFVIENRSGDRGRRTESGPRLKMNDPPQQSSGVYRKAL